MGCRLDIDARNSDRAAERPADRGTIWHWGSITKTLTAVAVMQLVEREMLSLADPVTLHVPEAVRINNPHGSMDRITLRHLMSHTSGLQNGTWPWGRGREWEPFEPTEWAQLVAMMPYMQVGFEPGSRYGYSNPAFVYLARAIESVSGDPWQGYVYKNLFAPLELNASYFGNTPWHLTAQRSHNYTVAGEDVRDNGADFDPGITIPNGGWNAPASDLSRWMSFLAGSSDPVRQARYDAILTRASLEQMWQPVAPIDEGYGMSEVGIATLNPQSTRPMERFAVLSVVVFRNRDRGFDSSYKAGHFRSAAGPSPRLHTFLAQPREIHRVFARQLQVPQNPENRVESLPVFQPESRRGGWPEGRLKAALLAQGAARKPDPPRGRAHGRQGRYQGGGGLAEQPPERP